MPSRRTVDPDDDEERRSAPPSQRRPGGPRRLRQDDARRAAAVQGRGDPEARTVDDGTAHLDFEPEEQKRRESLSLAVGTFEADGTRISLVDTPGYPDFVADVIEGFAAADGALFVIDASGGVEAGLEQAVALGRSTGRAACFFINKSDRENADPTAALDALRASFGDKIAPLQLAIGAAESFSGYVDLVHRKAYQWDGSKEVEIPIPDDMTAEVARRRDQLLEAAAEADDDVLTKYLEGEEIADHELEVCLRKGVKDSVLAPVLVGSAVKGIGLRGLLDAIVRYLPSPADEPPAKAADKARRPGRGRGGRIRPAARAGLQDHRGPVRGPADLPARAVRHAPLAGARLERHPRRGRADRPAAAAPRQGAGADRGAQGRRDRGGGQARGDRDRRRPGLEGEAADAAGARVPGPSLVVAIEPQSKGDLDKMGPALQRMLEEEPTVRLERTALGEQVLRTMGEAHISVITRATQAQVRGGDRDPHAEGAVQGDDPRQDPGPRPLQEADRRARDVRGRLARARAEPGRRRRVRRARGRRLGAQGLLRRASRRASARRRPRASSRAIPCRTSGRRCTTARSIRSTRTSSRSRSRPRWRSRTASTRRSPRSSSRS